jgi:hypothetical protein
MTQFDDKMKAALDADDEAFLRELDAEHGLFAQMGDTIKGPLGGWAILVFALALPLAALTFFSAWQMVQAPDTHTLILWTAATLAAMMSLGMAKLWLFERMNFIALLRELKKLELRLARIEDRG